jgi:hypothetical protein
MDELTKLVKEMRYWQIEYFKTRSKNALQEAKQYERAVDKLLDELETPGLF